MHRRIVERPPASEEAPVVEKIVYVVWKRDAVPVEQFRDALLGDVARTLVARGARGLAINVADDRAVQGARMARLDPTATVSIWMDTALDRAPLEQALAA